eukprot:snap_masked-scaffold_4-processed-gene-1.13-mRNA-1 protein AED:1.00 eAED:1.00 QI:0/0/0/0/1/1/2/0/108
MRNFAGTQFIAKIMDNLGSSRDALFILEYLCCRILSLGKNRPFSVLQKANKKSSWTNFVSFLITGFLMEIWFINKSGFVHGDIKPAKLMTGIIDVPKIIEFWLCNETY